MKKIQLFLIVLLVGIQAAFAQSVQVTGKVTYADDGTPVIGATINVKGTSIATLSDVNGDYKLTIPAAQEKVLVFSYTGLVSQQISAPTSGVYNVSMKTDALQAEDVVVTGYGNVSRKNYAGSAAVVATDKLKDVPTVSLSSRLAGNVAGLTVTSTSGQPGAVESVRLRGMGSINAGNEPLYVVDGVPVMSGNAASFSYAESGNSMMSSLNPADIESMTVIKDAAAASLYGSRAANGVIVITTKRGSAGKTRFNVKADLGFSDMAVNWRPVQDGATRRETLTLGLYNEGVYAKGMTAEAASAYAASNIDQYAAVPWSGYTNWRDLLFRQGFNQNYEVSAQGGNDKTKFYVSLGYTDQKGITYDQKYERYSGRVNVEHKSGILTLNASSMFSKVEQQVSSEGTSFSSPFMAVGMTVSPSEYAYNEDGTFNLSPYAFPAVGGGLSNPIYDRSLNYDKSGVTRSMSSVAAQLDLFKGFAIKQTLSYDYMATDNRAWWDPRSNNGQASGGVYQRYNNAYSRLTSQTMATYNRLFADVHSLQALVAWEAEKDDKTVLYANGNTYASPLKPEIGAAANTRASSETSRSTLLSAVAKIDYTYDNRIYVGASYRADGSSRLSPEKRWGHFWSASAFWRISNERWFREGGISNVLSDLKIRASYGVNGTQPNDWFDWRSYYGLDYKYNGFPGIAPSNIASADALSWEKSESANIGLDVTFIDRITLGLDFYNRDTKDLILEEPISLTTGFSKILRNVGQMNNKGIEASISAVAIQTKDVNWTIGFNISHNKNTLVALNEGKDQIVDGRSINRVGHSFYSIYTYEYAGVDPQTGKESWYSNATDADGNVDRTIVTSQAQAKQIIAGQVDHVVTGGLNSQFSYKWLDFGFTFTYGLGGNAYDQASWVQSNGGTYNYIGNVPTYYQTDKMWQKPGDIAELPKFQNGNTNYRSTRWMVSTDYLRLKNVTLGFSAPKNWTNKLKIEKLRIYASASNLFTIKDKGCYFDPEVPVNGMVTFQAPQLRVVTFGLEIGF